MKLRYIGDDERVFPHLVAFKPATADTAAGVFRPGDVIEVPDGAEITDDMGLALLDSPLLKVIVEASLTKDDPSASAVRPKAPATSASAVPIQKES
ncbi:MAG: hypothetical protein ACYDAD_11180 [Acidimicrobiales bacterium]